MPYSVIITAHAELGLHGAYVPAFDRWTEGHWVEDALDMGRDLIGICLALAREDVIEPPVETDAPPLTVVSVLEALGGTAA